AAGSRRPTSGLRHRTPASRTRLCGRGTGRRASRRAARARQQPPLPRQPGLARPAAVLVGRDALKRQLQQATSPMDYTSSRNAPSRGKYSAARTGCGPRALLLALEKLLELPTLVPAGLVVDHPARAAFVHERAVDDHAPQPAGDESGERQLARRLA